MVIAVTAILIFLNAFLFARLSAPRIRMAYLKSGRVDSPGGRKTQDTAIPYGGGLAVLVGFAGPVVFGILAAWFAFDGAPELLEVHAAGIRSKALIMATILLGASLMLFMGRADDRKNLPASIRFLIQLVAAFLVASAGVRVTLFMANPIVQVSITVLWLVFITNACNFIDNMDGLLCGTSLVSALSLAVISAFAGQLFVCAFALALAGALCGLLPLNRTPARIYLGDEGSMFIGFLLACLATLTTYSLGEMGGQPNIRPFVVPILCLLVPIADGCFVIARRIANGQAPWQAGLDHLSHVLVRSGHSNSTAVRKLWAFSLFGAATACLVQQTSRWAFGACAVFFLSGISMILWRPSK